MNGMLRRTWLGLLPAIWACGAPTTTGPRPRPDGASKPVGSAGHALVVGATGMLAPVTLALARRGFVTSAIARSPGPLEELQRQSDGGVHPLPLDYTDKAALDEALAAATGRHGPIKVVVAWIHSTAPDAPLQIASTVAGDHEVRFIHVLGSAADDPSAPDPARRAAFEALPKLRYEEVILGFVIDDDDSRWLTDGEISAGVLAAIDTPQARSIVGTTRPWSARP